MLQQALAELQAGCLVQICLLATSVLLISVMRRLGPGSFSLSGRYVENAMMEQSHQNLLRECCGFDGLITCAAESASHPMGLLHICRIRYLHPAGFLHSLLALHAPLCVCSGCMLIAAVIVVDGLDLTVSACRGMVNESDIRRASPAANSNSWWPFAKPKQY